MCVIMVVRVQYMTDGTMDRIGEDWIRLDWVRLDWINVRRQDLFHKEQIQGRRLVQLSLPLSSSSLPSSSSSLSLSSSLSNRQNRQAEEIGKECRVPHIDRRQRQRQRQLNILMTRHGTARHYNTRHYNTTQYDTMQHNTS